MSELKTLKDLEWDGFVKEEIIKRGAINPTSTVSVNEIKQEAIKYIKALLNEYKQCVGLECDGIYYFDDRRCPCSYPHGTMGFDERKWLIEWIKWFFNIDGGDLK